MQRQPFFSARHPLVLFFGLTFSLSWTIWLPMVVSGEESEPLRIAGTFGPAIVAVLLTAWLQGKAGLRKLAEQMLHWRLPCRWYGFAFLLPPLVILASIWLAVLAGMPRPEFNDPRQLYLVIPAFAFVLVSSVLGEEAGWRGFALPRMQAKWGALHASLILGLIWGIWHLPLFLIAGYFHKDIPFGLFLLQDIGLAIIMTWLYNSTKGSLFIVHMFHAAINTALGVLPILPMDTGGRVLPLWIAVLILTLIAGRIVIKMDPVTLAKLR